MSKRNFLPMSARTQEVRAGAGLTGNREPHDPQEGAQEPRRLPRHEGADAYEQDRHGQECAERPAPPASAPAGRIHGRSGNAQSLAAALGPARLNGRPGRGFPRPHGPAECKVNGKMLNSPLRRPQLLLKGIALLNPRLPIDGTFGAVGRAGRLVRAERKLRWPSARFLTQRLTLSPATGCGAPDTHGIRALFSHEHKNVGTSRGVDPTQNCSGGANPIAPHLSRLGLRRRASRTMAAASARHCAKPASQPGVYSSSVP
jgi:hypothetical protein